jgi:hypothetical protein
LRNAAGAERPVAEPQTEAADDSAVEMQARDERAVCAAERASAKGKRATGSPCSETNRALVTARFAVYAIASPICWIEAPALD